MDTPEEFEITVYTRVREVYVVQAASREEALKNWEDGELFISECVEVLEVEE